MSNEIEDFETPTLPGITEGEILVLRSTRRKKSASAYRQGGRIVISLPARMSKAEEAQVVPELIAIIRGLRSLLRCQRRKQFATNRL